MVFPIATAHPATRPTEGSMWKSSLCAMPQHGGAGTDDRAVPSSSCTASSALNTWMGGILSCGHIQRTFDAGRSPDNSPGRRHLAKLSIPWAWNGREIRQVVVTRGADQDCAFSSSHRKYIRLHEAEPFLYRDFQPNRRPFNRLLRAGARDG